MELLSKNIKSFTFEQVVDFCKKGHPEGIEIDYKREFPEKGLSKIIAAFSNTRGGVVVIGVEEDRNSGIPVKYIGVKDDKQLIERCYQDAGNISPMPIVETHKTNSINGQVFILVRVMEGDNTPYFVRNDSNIWVRTGNINRPVDIATPEWTEMLFGKAGKAAKTRENNIKLAEEVFDYSLKKGEKERNDLISTARQKGDGSETNYYQKPLGQESIMCTFLIQPYHPKHTLCSPSEMLAKVGEYQTTRGFGRFPDHNLGAIPQGVMHFKHGYNGYIESQQLYAHGLIFNSLDVLTIDEKGRRLIYLSHIAGRLISVLKTAKNFYNIFGYQGSLKGKVLLKNLEDIKFVKILPDNGFYFDAFHENLLPDYSWDINLDTRTLNDPDPSLKIYLSLLKSIYWDIGIKEFDEQIIIGFLEREKLL